MSTSLISKIIDALSSDVDIVAISEHTGSNPRIFEQLDTRPSLSYGNRYPYCAVMDKLPGTPVGRNSLSGYGMIRRVDCKWHDVDSRRARDLANRTVDVLISSFKSGSLDSDEGGMGDFFPSQMLSLVSETIRSDNAEGAVIIHIVQFSGIQRREAP